MPRFKSMAELPVEYGCRACKATKPTGEMVVVRDRRTGRVLLRPRCKACHNARERGHRREYKRRYLRLWRQRNPELNESYWRQGAREKRPEVALRAKMRFYREHDALLIQGRLRRRGMPVPLAEAKQLLKKFGPLYPCRSGLTSYGIRECERIRSRVRRGGKQAFSSFEIRLMVYEEGYASRTARIPRKHRLAAQRLSAWRVTNPHPWNRDKRVKEAA